MILKKCIRLFKDKDYRFIVFAAKGFYNNMSDEKYLKRMYKIRTGKELHLDYPQSFNEKIQWLKIYDHKPEYTVMVDKYLAKKYIANIIGNKYIIPTLGVWDTPEEIDFEQLPDQFVLKCTHNSGLGMCICKDKSELNIEKVKRELYKGLKQKYYYTGREWPYKDVKPRIIAEKYLEDSGRVVPEDYKIYCINGKPKYIVVFHDRFNDKVKPSESVYDTEWNRQKISLDKDFEISNIETPKPCCLQELLYIAFKLCREYAQVRLDFYIINEVIYFGEITFHTASGFQTMIPDKLDETLGGELILK